MFRKILIANRGEIAVRVIRACRDLGVSPIAIFSEADAAALHVRLADEAYCVGPAASSESYLKVESIIQVAKKAGVEAIHPGYGFLAENAEFARAVSAAGLIFIGPPADATERGPQMARPLLPFRGYETAAFGASKTPPATPTSIDDPSKLRRSPLLRRQPVAVVLQR